MSRTSWDCVQEREVSSRTAVRTRPGDLRLSTWVEMELGLERFPCDLATREGEPRGASVLPGRTAITAQDHVVCQPTKTAVAVGVRGHCAHGRGSLGMITGRVRGTEGSCSLWPEQSQVALFLLSINNILVFFLFLGVPFFFQFSVFLIDGKLFYNFVLVSALQQCKSVIILYMYTPPS